MRNQQNDDPGPQDGVEKPPHRQFTGHRQQELPPDVEDEQGFQNGIENVDLGRQDGIQRGLDLNHPG